LRSVVIIRSNAISPDVRVEKEAYTLGCAGFDVLVLGWDREFQFPEREDRGAFRIRRLRVRGSYGKGLRNAFNIIVWSIALFIWLARNRNSFSIIHACDFDTVIPALLCKFVFRKKLVYDIFDFYSDRVRGIPVFLRSMLRRAEIWAISTADATIIADEYRITQIDGAKPKRLIVVYNSPPNFECNSENVKVHQFTVGYVGLLSKTRGIFEMIRVIKLHPEWKLVIGGFGPDEDKVKSLIEKLPNARFIGRVSYTEALKTYCEFDVIFATYDPSVPNNRYSSANKLFEAMMFGLPIIVAANTGMDKLVQQHKIGFVVEYGNVEDLEKALMEIANWDPGKRSAFAEMSKGIFKAYYAWEIMEQRLIDLYLSF